MTALNRGRAVRRVTKWARELGDELYELGRQITKPDEIKRVSCDAPAEIE